MNIYSMYMQTRSSFLFVMLLVISNLSCNSPNRNVVKCALFLNPAQAFYSNEVHFKAKLNGSLILDTIVKNKRVDNSELLKCFNLKIASEQILSINVDGKEQQIHLNSKGQKCLNIFVKIDDHFLLDLKEDKIEREKLASGKNNNFNGRNILDSLRSNARNNEYDSIRVVIKNDKCYCEN